MKKTIRYILLCLTIFLLSFSTSYDVNASETDQPATYTVTGIENSEALSNLATFEIVRTSSQNSDPLLYHVFNNNLLRVNATIEDSEGNTTNKTLSVLWSFTNDETTVTDTTVCGEYLETGTIQLPDSSYVWGEGVLSVLTLPVKVYDPETPIEIVEFEEVWNEFSVAFSIEKNANLEEFLKKAPLQTAWPCYDANGNEYTCPVVYNTANVKVGTVGIYEIIATFEEPLNCRFSDNLTVPTYSLLITVQDPKYPRLDLFYLSPNYEYILFPWVTSGINYDSIEVWMSENEGEWRKLELDDEVYVHPNEIDLYAWYLNEGSYYQVKAKYEGGETGIACFTYGWDVLTDKEYIGGDRDGGDTGGNPPPKDPGSGNDNSGEDNTPDTGNNDSKPDDTPINPTPTPQPPVKDAPVSKPKKKTDGLSSSEERDKPYLLGSELNLMIENTKNARFSSDSIMLIISEEAIKALNIGDMDQFLVNILPLKNNGFSIQILKNNIEITMISDMEISLPFKLTQNTIPVLVNEAGVVIAEGTYDISTGLATFIISETGSFFVKEKEIQTSNISDVDVTTTTTTDISTAEKEQTDNYMFIVIAIIVSVITCSIIAIIYFYTKKRSA